MKTIVVGTRGSDLARRQTELVIESLRRIAIRVEFEVCLIRTSGDKDQVRPLAELGGRGVFTTEIESALRASEIDLAVHSLKDLPVEDTPGLVIAGIPEREDARECVVSRLGLGLMQLPARARVGTSSGRRAAQVLALRPDVQIVSLRGNVDTRLRKAQTAEYDAVLLAAAGIHRLGRADAITEYLSPEVMLPDAGQGALAIQTRADDAPLVALAGMLTHAPTAAAVTAERAFLQALGGGCRTAVGAYGEFRSGLLHLRGVVAGPEGAGLRRGEMAGEMDRPAELGRALAAQLTG